MSSKNIIVMKGPKTGRMIGAQQSMVSHQEDQREEPEIIFRILAAMAWSFLTAFFENTCLIYEVTAFLSQHGRGPTTFNCQDIKSSVILVDKHNQQVGFI